MSTPTFNFTYEEFKKKNYPSLKTIKFGKVYDEFNNMNEIDTSVKKKCTKAKSGLPINDIYDDLSNKFCYNLYKIIVIVNGWQNDNFKGIDKDDNMNCLYLKYWLYEKIENLGPKGLGVETFFQSLKNKLEHEISSVLPKFCTFNKLNSTEIDKIRSIYAFLLIYYRNIENFHNEKHILCDYLNYFGKGLKSYYESIRECSNRQNDNNYCKELKELEEIYKLDKLYWKHSTLNTGYIYADETSSDCPLVIESLKDPLRLTYKEAEYTLNISNQPIDSLNSSIISASSAMGATVGISAFLLYLFKYTSLGLLFRSQKQKDNIILNNMDGEAYDFTFTNSEYKPDNIENTDYNISYFSLNNS
ncbi:PIR Superfamily Protein [Plasmodium ovale wallikeri]|uniref:PIR Superfamily Protein n=1 Tax=Plasmodium ovale wallikeri TaxID=864142 RepID=A0A1A9A5I7_PLAOA|nr:PIR Superfamily Protein [Plasmodium ovale wallikeri]